MIIDTWSGYCGVAIRVNVLSFQIEIISMPCAWKIWLKFSKKKKKKDLRWWWRPLSSCSLYTAAFLHSPHQPVYTATKHGVIGFTRAIAVKHTHTLTFTQTTVWNTARDVVLKTSTCRMPPPRATTASGSTSCARPLSTPLSCTQWKRWKTWASFSSSKTISRAKSTNLEF